MQTNRKRTGSRRRALAAVIDVIAIVSGNGELSTRRSWTSLTVMMALALVGVIIWFAVIGVAGLVIVAFGLADPPRRDLGAAVSVAGSFGGLVAAAIVMLRIVRRHRRLVHLAGFGELARDAIVGDPAPAIVSSAITPRPRLADLDARFASSAVSERPRASHPEAPTEADEPPSRP